MTKFSKKIEAIMSAVSFAEEGDFKTAKEMLKREKRVLLAVNNWSIDTKALKYAVNTCKRINAELDILMVGSGNTDDSKLRQFRSIIESEGVKTAIHQKEGCLKQAIVDYTESEKDILFVVIESERDLDSRCGAKAKKLSETWQRLKCPLVVVSEGARA